MSAKMSKSNQHLCLEINKNGDTFLFVHRGKPRGFKDITLAELDNECLVAEGDDKAKLRINIANLVSDLETKDQTKKKPPKRTKKDKTQFLIDTEIRNMNSSFDEFEEHNSWQPLDRVHTIVRGPRDYTEKGISKRKCGLNGTVVDLSNSHGLCFKVIHDDGTSAYYDPDELVRTFGY